MNLNNLIRFEDLLAPKKMTLQERGIIGWYAYRLRIEEDLQAIRLSVKDKKLPAAECQ